MEEKIINLEISIERNENIYILKNMLREAMQELNRMNKKTKEFRTFKKKIENLGNYIFSLC